MDNLSKKQFYSNFMLKVTRVTIINAVLSGVTLLVLSQVIDFPFNRLNYGMTLWWISIIYFLPVYTNTNPSDFPGTTGYAEEQNNRLASNIKFMLYGGISFLLSIYFMFF